MEKYHYLKKHFTQVLRGIGCSLLGALRLAFSLHCRNIATVDSKEVDSQNICEKLDGVSIDGGEIRTVDFLLSTATLYFRIMLGIRVTPLGRGRDSKTAQVGCRVIHLILNGRGTRPVRWTSLRNETVLIRLSF